jgi:hypothetical protein
MNSELENHRRKFAPFPQKIKAEIAAIEKRLEALRRIAAMLEERLLKEKSPHPRYSVRW